MKILNMTQNTYVCSLSKDELEIILGKSLYAADIKEIFEKEKELNIKQISPLASDHDIVKIEQATAALQSAISFLNNKKEAINYLNSFKLKK